MIQPSPVNPPPEMGIGAILGTTFQVYRTYFTRFLVIVLRAYAWAVGLVVGSTILLLGAIVLLSIAFRVQESALTAFIFGLIFLLLGIVWLVVYLFGVAKFLTNLALIGRLTYNHLAQRIETPNQSCEALKDKTWAFLRISFYVGLMAIALYIGIVFVAVILGTIAALALGASDSSFAGGGVAFILGAALYGLIAFTLFVYMYSRWFVSEIVLSVENIKGAVDSIGKSWDLSKSFVFKIVLLSILGFLITAPVLIAIELLPQVIYWGSDVSDSTIQTLSLIAALVNSFIALAIIPFWQVLKGVVYFDMSVQSGAPITQVIPQGYPAS